MVISAGRLGAGDNSRRVTTTLWNDAAALSYRRILESGLVITIIIIAIGPGLGAFNCYVTPFLLEIGPHETPRNAKKHSTKNIEPNYMQCTIVSPFPGKSDPHPTMLLSYLFETNTDKY